MKKKTIIISATLFLLFLIPLAFGGGYMEFLTKGLADTLYCRVKSCTIENLIVNNLTINNGTVNFLNTTVTNINVTGEFLVSGNISSEQYCFIDGDGNIISCINQTNITADRKTATFVVAASDSNNPNSADFVGDNTAIVNAMNALPAGGGKVILLEGTYQGGFTIPSSNIVLEGQGVNSIVNGSITLEDISDVVLTNLNIEGTILIATLLGDTSRIWIKDNTLTGTIEVLALGNNPDRLYIINNRIIGFIDLSQNPDAIISGNIIEATTLGIRLDDNDRIQIVNNKIDGSSSVGLDFFGDDGVVSNNLIRNSNTIGMRVATSNNNVFSNNIIDTSATDGIEIQTSDRNIFSANRVLNSNASGGFFEVDITSSTSDGNMIINNNLFDTNNNNTINDLGTNTTIIGNYPGGSSMEIQTAAGQEIKMIPEGTHTATFYPINTTFNYPICFNDGTCFNATNVTSWDTGSSLWTDDGNTLIPTNNRNVTASYLFGNNTKTATVVVAASNSKNKQTADFICTGSNDDVCIENALGALPAGGGKVVLLEGTFSLGNQIDITKDNIFFSGQGTSSIITRDGSSNSVLIYMDERSDILIENLQFTSNTYGIAIARSNRVSILGNYFNTVNGDAAIVILLGSLDDTERSIISNNMFESSTSVLLDYMVDSIISNNIFKDSSSDSIRLTNSDNNVIINNKVEGYGFSFSSSDNNIVSSNLLKDHSASGITITNSNYNMFSNNRIDNYGTAINLISGSGNTIATNILFNNPSTINDSGTDTTIIGNYPGGSSMEIQTAAGQEIKMIPEGTETAIIKPELYNISGKVIAYNFSGIYDWIIRTGLSTFYLDFNGTQLEFNETYLNQTIRSFTDTVTYNATWINITTGTHDPTSPEDDGNLTSILTAKDSNSFNVTEVAGASPSTIFINFTNVDSFSTILLRQWYEGGSGHNYKVGLETCADGSYEEEYPPDITDEDDYAFSLHNVLDPSSHICTGGKVSVRIRHVDNGNPAHVFHLDYAVLQSGATTVVAEEVDPLAMHKTGDVLPSGNFNWNKFNITNIFRLGIGTSAPMFSLDINGTARITEGLSVRNVTINKNLTISNGTLGSNIWHNGSGICIGSC